MLRTTIARFVSALADVTTLSCVGLAFWYVFGGLPNLLPIRGTDFLGLVMPPIDWLLGLAIYMFAGGVLILIFKAVSRIVLVGWDRFIVEEKEQSAASKKAAIRQVGTLVTVSTETAYFLDSSTSMIETTEGFYRVFGKIDSAAKGESVTIQKESRGFFTLEWLCFAGKKYQLTK